MYHEWNTITLWYEQYHSRNLGYRNSQQDTRSQKNITKVGVEWIHTLICVFLFDWQLKLTYDWPKMCAWRRGVMQSVEVSAFRLWLCVVKHPQWDDCDWTADKSITFCFLFIITWKWFIVLKKYIYLNSLICQSFHITGNVQAVATRHAVVPDQSTTFF